MRWGNTNNLLFLLLLQDQPTYIYICIKTSKIINYIVIILYILYMGMIPHTHARTHRYIEGLRVGKQGRQVRRQNLKSLVVLFVETSL